MSTKTDAEFEGLVEGMLEEAESVECSQHEYLDGLKIIFGAVRDRVEMVTAELKGQKREDDNDEEDDEGDESEDESGDED